MEVVVDIGPKGMLYLLVQKVVSKNMQSLYFGYSALVLPSTQNNAVTEFVAGSFCFAKKNSGFSAFLLSKYFTVISMSYCVIASRSFARSFATSLFTYGSILGSPPCILPRKLMQSEFDRLISCNVNKSS